MSARVLKVEDHGMWRGRRTWTVWMDGPTGRAQVSAIDVETEAAAREQAAETYAARRVFTDEEREAMSATSAALRRGLR